MTWQPIETAPKDGSFVLGCQEGPWTEWFRQSCAPQTVAYRTYHPNQPGKAKWRDKDGKPVFITHWMPLPPAP